VGAEFPITIMLVSESGTERFSAKRFNNSCGDAYLVPAGSVDARRAMMRNTYFSFVNQSEISERVIYGLIRRQRLVPLGQPFQVCLIVGVGGVEGDEGVVW
jgi:hypothetical protein